MLSPTEILVNKRASFEHCQDLGQLLLLDYATALRSKGPGPAMSDQIRLVSMTIATRRDARRMSR